LPHEISDKEAILLSEPLTIGYNWVKQGLEYLHMDCDDAIVVVLGCNACGLSAVLSALYLGVKRVIAVDSDPLKLEIVRTFGEVKCVQNESYQIGDLIKKAHIMIVSMDVVWM